MKIAITGYTKGIGKALYDDFVSKGHEVIGFSRGTGHNISTDTGIQKVVKDAGSSDLIIINAYDVTAIQNLAGFSQTTLLYEMFNQWLGKDKTIVVIGSLASTEPDSSLYTLHKTTLAIAVQRLRQLAVSHPRLIMLNPGYVDTEMSAFDTVHNKLNPQDICDILYMVLNNKVRISNISFEH